VSEEVTQQFHEGAGVHFARKIRFIACHYQLLEQLPDEERGSNRGQSLLNDEQIQTAARTHLLTLPTVMSPPDGSITLLMRESSRPSDIHS
jgi:hypothetical protein